MIKDSNIRFSGVTSKDIYKAISQEAERMNITVSKYISVLLEREVSRITGNDPGNTRGYAKHQ